jgi:hypothetical protein
MKLVKFEKSTRDGKKYMVVTQDGDKKKTIHFGAEGYEDFTEHKDEKRKELYLKRHEAREDWTDPMTAGFWSRWILWNKTSIKMSLSDTIKRFNLK